MATTPTVSGFSVTHAAILDGTDGTEEEFGDIYGVRSGSIELDSDSYDNTGDDTVMESWFWGNKANLTIQGGYVPFQTLALISGSTLTSSGAVDSETFYLPLWEERQMNTVPRPVKIRIASKDMTGKPRSLDFILFKVQFQPFTFDGIQYKEGLTLNYNGSALFSSVDHKGAAVVDSVTSLPTRRIGTVVSAPQ